MGPSNREVIGVIILLLGVITVVTGLGFIVAGLWDIAMGLFEWTVSRWMDAVINLIVGCVLVGVPSYYGLTGAISRF